MIKSIDEVLNKVTMYRLVLYELLFLLIVAGALGFFKILPYDPIMLGLSVGVIFCTTWLVNRGFAAIFNAPYNPESTWITALILALIITPAKFWGDPQFFQLALWASAWASASKYIFAIRKKHIFNPAALGVAMTGLVGFSASWWVGTPIMVPFVLAGGLLIVRKIHRYDLWWAFIGMFSAGIVYLIVTGGGSAVQTLSQSFLYGAVFFFGTVMLTEPMTTPPTRALRLLYGALTGLFMLPNFHIGSYYLTPEVALLAGNVFSYLVSPKQKLVLKLKEKIELSDDVLEFVFTPERRFTFKPGQYMEWTLPHQKPDSRGVRRFFSITSAPSDPDLRLGVKFYLPASSFKKELASMKPGDTIVASQLAGDFTLPRNIHKKLVFIAGGIGVTPFRSMLQDLLDRREKRPITVIFANKTPADVVYHELLDRAARELNIKTVYAFTDPGVELPPGSIARLDPEVIMREVPDFRERKFYLSGPQGMVHAFQDMLASMGIRRDAITTDYFPGFA